MHESDEALKLVFAAIKGNHVGRLERVEIGGQRGTKITITSLVSENTDSTEKATSAPAVEPTKEELEAAHPLDSKGNALGSEVEAAPVNPGDINKRTAAIKADAPKVAPEPAKPLTKKDEMSVLVLDFLTAPTIELKKTAAEAVAAFKKASKKSYSGLGVSPDNEKEITDMLSGTSTPVASKPAPEPVKTAPVQKPKATKAAPQPEAPKAKPKGVKEEARFIFDGGRYTALVDFAKSKKKSLVALGFTDAEIKLIKKHTS